MSRRLTPGLPDLIAQPRCGDQCLIGGRFRLLQRSGFTLASATAGRDILATRTVPRVDHLTFTQAGQPWVDQSWLFDVALAAVVDRGGWALAGVVCAVGIAAIYAGLARRLLRDGSTPLAAL